MTISKLDSTLQLLLILFHVLQYIIEIGHKYDMQFILSKNEQLYEIFTWLLCFIFVLNSDSKPNCILEHDHHKNWIVKNFCVSRLKKKQKFK